MTKFYLGQNILTMMYPSSQSLFCCLCEDLPEHTKGGVATALPCPGKPDISRIFATLCTGCSGRHSDLLDDGGEQRVWPTGGGLRERLEGLLQEADRATQLPHMSAPRQPQQGRSTEGDHLISTNTGDDKHLQSDF